MKSIMRVYLDTSVLGAYFEAGHDILTIAFFEKFKGSHFDLLLSDTLVKEIEFAPAPVRSLLADLIEMGVERISVTEEAVNLMNAYLSANIISDTYMDDALHVAIAVSISEVDDETNDK